MYWMIYNVLNADLKTMDYNLLNLQNHLSHLTAKLAIQWVGGKLRHIIFGDINVELIPDFNIELIPDICLSKQGQQSPDKLHFDFTIWIYVCAPKSPQQRHFFPLGDISTSRYTWWLFSMAGPFQWKTSTLLLLSEIGSIHRETFLY